ncbi:MAG: HPr(Ser) kinase/phosphatase [Clostridiaceae bacterium]|jgi:HPr kinase/phosphorylase|nr:HPr(Ser) kinase/phosphatase [Bacillota bacterium]NLN51955.1 HPr(Ser) kinase/phosphatase [Clostridiaceae bacterium]
MDSVNLNDLIKEFELEVIRGFDKIDSTELFIPDVTRPGLQLAGNYMHFGPDRIQLIGNMEIAYLNSLAEEERRYKYNALFATGIPCLVLSRNHIADPIMLEVAENYKTPILSTAEGTASFYSSVSKYLNVELAERISLHGVFIEVYGEGILMLGDSGVGKSETALEIVKRGHRLIADDLVEIRRVSDTTLLGRAPDIIRHLIEIRGIGILDVKELYGVSSVKMQENIQFVINLEFWDETKAYDRLGLIEETTEILGIEIPSITIPVRPGRNLAIIVEVAAINFRQKTMGYNAALALTERVFN